MRISMKIIALAVFCLGLTNCITVTHVEKFTGNEKGIRYSLPATYLLVTPKSDGTADYNWVYLPDPQNEYAVETYSFMSKYTIDLSFENNLLKKVSLKADNTTVAAKLADAAQSVYTTRATAASDAAKKVADKKSAAQKAIADAQLELSQAKAALMKLEELGKNKDNGITAADIAAAEVKVAQAQAKVDSLKQESIKELGAMNAPKDAEGMNRTGQAWGPVLFKVVQYEDEKKEDNVKLVAVNIQHTFDTATAVTPKLPVAAQAFYFKGSSRLTASEVKKFSVVADQEIFKVYSDKAILYKDNKLIEHSTYGLTFTLQPDNKTVVINFSKGLPAGKYKMTLPYSTKATEKPKSDSSISFEVMQ